MTLRWQLFLFFHFTKLSIKKRNVSTLFVEVHVFVLTAYEVMCPFVDYLFKLKIPRKPEPAVSISSIISLVFPLASKN